jgi:enoyl-[acyl-carrier-protein] reductase (NADH)
MMLLDRTVTIGDAADTIVCLCSPISNYVTAQLIPVNGGAHGGMT